MQRFKKMLLLLPLLCVLLWTVPLPESEQMPAAVGEEQPEITLNVCAWLEEAEYVKLLATHFMAEYPEINLRLTLIPKSEYTQQMLKVKNQNISFDCVMFPTMAEAAVWINKDTLADIRPFMNSEGEEYYYDEWHCPEDTAASYLLPYRKSCWAVYYNKRLFDAIGVAYPQEDWTWEDYGRIAEKLTSWVNASKTYGSLSFNPAEDRWSIPAATLGAYDPGDSRQLEQLKQSAQWWHQLTYEKHAQPAYSLQTGAIRTDYDNQFLKGNIGMYISNDWSLTELNKKIAALGYSFDYDVVPLPHWEGEEHYNVFDVHVAAMIEGTAHPEAAYAFVRFVTGEKGAEILARQGLIPAWNTAEIRQLYVSNNQSPRHREVFWDGRTGSSVSVSASCYERMDIVKAAVARYLLTEWELEQTFLEISFELENLGL